MEAFKCDRCKQFSEGEPIAILEYTLSNDHKLWEGSRVTIQLCRPCTDSLIKWKDNQSKPA